MGEAGFIDAERVRLPARLAALLAPELQNALDHPVRREVLRTLDGGGRPRNIPELGAELRGFSLSQISYHMQVLRQYGAVASAPCDAGTQRNSARYSSEVGGDGQVKAVLRATERWDRQHREATAAAATSPLLTMFRVPRPVRTIRLRGRRKLDSEMDR